MILCPHCGKPCRVLRRFTQVRGDPPQVVVRAVWRCDFQADEGCRTQSVRSAIDPWKGKTIRSRSDYLEPLGPHPLKVPDPPPDPPRRPMSPKELAIIAATMGMLGGMRR